MAIINQPAAGVSPYQEAAAAPIVLTADANGNTVLANPTAAATAAANVAAANANGTVIVNGAAALNSLIATSRSGVFEGANVTINLEEQNFNTTNQVTSNTNYPAGGAGEIQFNSGSNSFASNAYFTYDNSNVITPGIRTDGYFYSNGAPFIGGGNAAIGNFVFTGDNMTIAHTNSTLSVTGNGTGNVNISANSKTWTFAADANLTIPGNIQMGNTRGIYSSSTGYVVGLRMSNTEPSVKLVANDHEWQFNSNGILKLPVPFSSVYPSLTMTNSSNLLISGYQGAGFGEDGGNITVGGGTSDSGNIGNATVFGQQVIVQTQLDGGSPVQNWIFGSDGNTTFPNDTIQSPANIELSVRSSTTSDDDNQVKLNQTSLDIYAYNSNTGSYSELYLDNSSASTPYAYISVEATSSPERRWVYSSDGNLRLPAGTPSINYANGSPYSQENKIFNGNTYANIDFPSGNLAIGVDVTPVTGAWINTYGNIVINDIGNSEGESVLIDGGGNVYVTGASYNPAFSADQAYVRKLSPSGQVMWEQALPQSVNGSQFTSGETLAKDNSGNIYWLTNLWFDNGGNVQPMVAKLNSSNGYPLWTTQIGNVYYGEDITVNSSGQVFIVTNTSGRITSLNANGTVAWSLDPSNGGVSIVDTGTYVIMGYINGNVAAYDYSGNLLWTNQVFNTGHEIWGLAWDGTDWYAADDIGNIMKISGSDNSTILWQKHINRNGTGGNIFNTWIEYADGYIYAGGTGNDGQVSDAFITVKINASNGNLVWARSLEAQTAGQWYWYGHHDISVGGGGYYAITGYAQPAGLTNDKQVLAQLPIDGSLAGSTVGPYRYVDVPALTMDTTDVGGTGYNGSPSQPATVSVTHNYTFTGLVAPSREVNILEPFVTGPVWTFDNTGNLTLPGNTFAVNYANNQPVQLGSGSYGNSDVANFLADFGSNNITGTGIVTANEFATNGNLYIGNIGFIPGSLIAQGNATMIVAATGASSSISVGWAENLFAPGNVAFIDLNNSQSGNAVIVTGNNTSAYNWSFDNTGNLTAPNKVTANSVTLKNTDDFAQIVFSNDGGSTNNGQIKVDGGTNMVISSASNFSVKRAGSDRISVTDTTSDLSAATNVRIQSNETGSAYTWSFNSDASVLFPYQPTNQRTGSGEALVFAKSANQKVIATAPGDVGQPTVSRLVIAGGDGFESGEGGDIYLWAGKSGVGVAGGSGGGDIKIDAGEALNSAQGGTIKIRAGDSYDQGIGGGTGGFIEIYAGSGNIGAEVDIRSGSGNSQVNSGNVTITTPFGGTWRFDQYGNTSFPSGIVFSGTDLIAAGGNYIELASNNGNTYVGVDNANAFIQTDFANNNYTWTFGVDGELYLPTGGRLGATKGGTMLDAGNGSTTSLTSFYGDGYFSSCVNAGPNGMLYITAYNDGGPNPASQWTFDNSGNLSLPLGGVIHETAIPNNQFTGNTIAFTPSGGISADQQLLIYPTVTTDANHLHLTSGNLYNTELFLGNDDLYVKLANTGNIVVNTNDLIGNSAQWIFGTDGNLTTPGASGNITGANVIIANILSAIGDVESANVKGATLSAIGNVIGNNAVITNGISGSTLQLVGTANVGNLSAVGSVSATGNITSLSTIYSGNGATWQTAVELANVLFVGADVGESYVQAAMVNTGGNGSSDWVSYANNGNTDQAWIDMGFTGNTFNDPAYTVTNPNDGYILVQGNASFGGNLILATGNIGTTKDIVFATGGFGTGNIKARLYNSTGAFSVVGNVAANYFVGNGSQLTNVAVPSQTILPTIQTISAIPMLTGYLSGGQGGVTVTVANVIPVTEYGVIVTAGTTSQKYATGSLGSIPGTGNITFTTGTNSAPFTVYAYVTSNAGTYYSNAVTGTSGICLLAGTQIALSDGSHKAIEDITGTDKLLSWDFDRGCYVETTALWIKRSETGSQYNLLTFSDGTTLRTFDQHRIFNKQAGAFTYPMTDATPVGTVTVNEHGQEIILTNKQVIEDTIDYYNVITDHHMNLFSDTVLTSCRFNNIYPITDMKFVKDSRTPRTREEFANIPERFFHGLRLSEQTVDVDAAEWYVNRLMATEVATQAELAS
jgi:hypothetical protein